MRVICAPDSFKESLSACDAAAAMATGIRRVCPDVEIDRCPVADGGEGTVDVLLAALGGQPRSTLVVGPCGEPVEARWALLQGGELAVVEMAAAAGLTLVPRDRRDPTSTTTYGVGQLLLAACAAGARRVFVAVGGSATTDGGCGMAQALGIVFSGVDGVPITTPLTGGALHAVAHIDASGRSPLLAGVTVTVASDVTNPLTGASGAARVFGPQKGADATQIERLDAGLAHLARIIRTDLGVAVEHVPGAGAAGGLGAGLLAFADARLESGINLILEAVRFDARVRGCRVCLTGEGRLDAQTVAGKACLGVARAADRQGVPTIALVGAVGAGADQALAAGLADYRVIGPGLSRAQSMRRAPELLAAAAAAAMTPYL